MLIDGQFIGRDREVAQLERFIGSGTDGLRFAMLSGPSGLGKTTLSDVAAREAAHRGFRVATVNGRAGSLSTPFAPLREAMPEFEVLLAVLAGDQNIDMDHAGIGLVNLLAELTSDQPLLLVFDDAQALDESSIALLPYIVGVSERMNLSLMFVEQTDAVGVPSSYRAFIDGLLARRVVGHLELGPMADEAIAQLVRLVLELDEGADVPAEVVTRAQGNPWFAKELAASFARGATDIPSNIAAAATARLHTLDETGQDIVFAAALCPEGAHIGWLEALADQKPRQFVRTMEAIGASGLTREDADVISIAHPLMQQALIDELSAAMRRAIHAELAAVIADVPLPEVVSARGQGYHLSRAGRTDEAVAHYLRAADANDILGQVHEAYADCQRAVDAEPRVEARVPLLRRCAMMAMQLGKPEAISHWTELGRVASAMNDDETYAYALLHQYWTCVDGTALDRLQRAANLGSDRIGWAAHAQAVLAGFEGNFAEAITHDTRALELARDNHDAVLEALVLQALGASHAYVGELEASATYLHEAVAVGIRERLHGVVVSAWYLLIETLSESLETTRALDESRSALTYVDDLGLDRQRPVLLATHGRMLLHAGSCDDALNAVHTAVQQQIKGGLGGHHVVVVLAQADVEIEVGGAVQAEEAAQASFAVVADGGPTSWAMQAQHDYIRLLLRTGKADEAIRLSREVDLSEDVATATLAQWFARHGALAKSQALLDRAEEIAAAAQGAVPLARLQLDECAAIIAGDLDALRSISNAWSDRHRVLDALRTQAVLGMLETASDRSAGIALLKQVNTGLAACGATADADIVASLLRSLGTRSRARSRVSQVGPLTKRELEIARLVASGLKNSEVAAQLYLSEKTVAAHLSNIYGKLEVRSRVQLTAWINDNDPAAQDPLAEIA